ncbi:MAG: hypothetical protein JNK49_02625 [Planctomycetes bacterium]|nr:hypothetical protein [Planctomycetota bacterium]
MRHPSLLFFLVLGPTLLKAQVAVDTAPRSFAELAGVVEDPSGTPWAVGPDYKAALRPGGIDFVPALPTAPHNRVWSLRLDRITRGSELLHAATTDASAPAPKWYGGEVTYQRGGIVEHYRVDARGLELSFIFNDRPAGDGDLVVHCKVGGGLQPEQLTDGTLRFTDGQFGGVHVGHVTGIDARGERCRGELAMVDGQLELRLPDAFVDTAQFPLVLDPWLSTASLVPQGGGNDSFLTGTTGAGGFAVFTTWAWCRTFSQSDSDVYAVNSNSASTLLGIANTANLVETAPVIANANIWQPIVWQEGPTANGPWTVKVRPFFVSQGLPLQPVTTIAASGERPSVSGRRDAGATGFNSVLVSYVEPGVGIRVRPFTAPTTVGAVQTVASATGGNTIVGTPRLSDSYTGTSPAALICTISPAISPNTHTLNVLAINASGQSIGSANLITANGIDFDPAIAGNGNHFLAAFTRFGQLQQVRLTWNGTTLTAGAPTLFDSVRGKSPALAWCSDRYVALWGRATATTGDDEIVLGVYRDDGTPLRPLQTLPTVAQPNQQQPTIRSGFADNGNPLRAVVSWIETPIGGGSGTACTRTFVTMEGGTPVNLGGSCLGNSCTSLLPCGYTQGAFAPGNQTFQMRLQYQDQSAPLAALNLALGAPAPITCGLCQYMPPVASQVLPNAPGELSFTWALPLNYSFVGIQIQFQWMMLGTTSSPCSLAPNVIVYNRVSVTIAE